MPELPEVEVIVRGLRGPLAWETVSDVRVRWPRSIACPSVAEFRERLVGRQVSEVARRGKFVVFTLSSGALLVHLGMTGQLLLTEASDAAMDQDKHVQVIVSFESGRTLYFRDLRKFGRLHLVNDAEQVCGCLGPEPLSAAFTPEALEALLSSRRRQLKPLLLDQHVLAGLGNIYADEALWHAGLHPLRRSHTLASAEIECLHAAIRRVLSRAIANKGTTLRDYRDPQGKPGENQMALAAYGQQGEPCPRCGAPIVRCVVGSRGTHYCPVCQPLEAQAAEKE